MRVAIVAMGHTNRHWFNEVYYPKKRQDFHQKAFDTISPATQKAGLPQTPQTLRGVVELSKMFGDAVHIADDYDEVWVINNMGKLLKRVDKIFHMDDLSVPEAEGLPTDVTIVTTAQRHNAAGEPYKCELYPIKEIVEKFGSLYFNNTIAYTIAYAILKEVSFIGFYGCDFTPHQGHGMAKADSGASCCEYWMRILEDHKIPYFITKGSRFMGMDTDQRLYGYMRQPVITLEDRILEHKDGKWNVRPIPQSAGSEKPDPKPKAAKVRKKTVRPRKKAK